MDSHRSIRDILSGLIFIGLALAFGIAAAGYDRGTALSMGPGYFPLLLAGLLGLLGAGIVAKGILAAKPESDVGYIPWRGVFLLLGAVIFFGATVRGLGLVPALFITAGASALASRRNTPLNALLIAAILTLFCVLIFSYGLGLPLPLIGPWLQF